MIKLCKGHGDVFNITSDLLQKQGKLTLLLEYFKLEQQSIFTVAILVHGKKWVPYKGGDKNIATWDYFDDVTGVTIGRKGRGSKNWKNCYIIFMDLHAPCYAALNL